MKKVENQGNIYTNMYINNWLEATMGLLQEFWSTLATFLPSLVGALITLILGLIIASGLRSIVERIIAGIKLDSMLSQAGVSTYVERGGMRLNSGKFLGAVVYWFFVIVFVLAATEILGLQQVAEFFRGVLNYIPNVVVAILILLVSLVVGNFLSALVRASVMSARLHASKVLGAFTWWIVLIVGIGTALRQLEVADLVVVFINYLVAGIVAMIAIAGGIAFGLGGKEVATHWLEKMRRELE